jgi:hypothetical protein
VCLRDRAKERNGESQFNGMFSIVDIFSLAQKIQITNAEKKIDQKNRTKKPIFRKSAITLKKLRYSTLKKN